MTSIAVFGCTGAVGSNVLATLLANQTSTWTSVKTISRRVPQIQSPKLEVHQEADTSKWGEMISTLTPKPYAVFNAVGTTRAIAGSTENQWRIDHDLCIENAKRAKEAGVKTYIYISSFGTRGFPGRYFPYGKMKVGVEDAIKDLGFDQAIILRPGFILGERETPKAPTAEKVISNLHRLSQRLQDSTGQDQKIIGRAAVAALCIADAGKAPSKYWVLEGSDIIEHGREQWRESVEEG